MTPTSPKTNSPPCVNSPFWIVFDIRPAQAGVVSGISRVIVMLIEHLLPLVQEKPLLKILLVSPNTAPVWVQQCVQTYPNTVEFFQCKGPWWARLRKLPWLWSTLTFGVVLKKTNRHCVWIAPANTDRPLFGCYLEEHKHRVVQIVHDVIPLQPHTNLSFSFRLQFFLLVKNSLKKLPHIFTVSSYSAKRIQEFRTKLRKNKLPLPSPVVIPLGVGQVFGHRAKLLPNSPSWLQERQKNISRWLNFSATEQATLPESLLESFLNGIWLVGIGRSEPYKKWDFGRALVQHFTTQNPLDNQKIWWVRVGAHHTETPHTPDFATPTFRIYAQQHTVIINQPLDDTGLENLYQCADLLLHPSQGEGFGLPPLEAALTGLPVLYNATTAVNDHFSTHALPREFWCGLPINDMKTWNAQALVMLLAARQKENATTDRTKNFYRTLYESPQARTFVLENAPYPKMHSWHHTAECFLHEVQLIQQGKQL